MIYVFLAQGCEELEALAPVDIFRRAELDVTTVGVGGKRIAGAHGIVMECDIPEEEASPEGLEMIVLPGGMPGTLYLERSAYVREFLQLAVQDGLWIGAICAAPSILGHLGLLEGRKATCFPGFEEELAGAHLSDAPVVRDGKIVTAKGPGAAVEFALELLSCLTSRERADLLRKSLQCPR